MLMQKILVAGVAIGTGTIAVAQDYFDFGQIPGVPDEPAIQVDLSPTLLGIASQTTRTENPAASELLASIDGVRVRVYKSLEDIDDVVAFIQDVSDRLERDDWESVVSVQDDANIRVYIQADEDIIRGLTAMVVHDNEAVFVNVVGTISAQQLADAIAAMDGGEMFASLGDFNLPAAVPAE